MRIARAAQQVGISPTTLKRLEKRGLIHPRKDRNGQRRYTIDDIQRIRALYYPAAPEPARRALDADDRTA
jgi:DNA-binding transcriptional MerR regulator